MFGNAHTIIWRLNSTLGESNAHTIIWRLNSTLGESPNHRNPANKEKSNDKNRKAAKRKKISQSTGNWNNHVQ